MGLKAFRRIQVSNVEGTPGTAEAAVEVLSGTMTFDDGLAIHSPEEDRNTLAKNVGNDLVVGKEAHLTWQADLNFRQIAWALAMAIRGNITPTQPDAVNEPLSYLWTFTPSLTAPNTPDQTNGIDTFTFEYGDDKGAYETEFCFATRLEISGAANETVKMVCEIVGRQVTSGITFTAELTMPAVQRAAFNKSKIYIDAQGGTMGATQKTDLVKAITWELETMFTAAYGPDGALYFTAVEEDKKAPVVTVTYKRGTASLTEEAAYRARTTRLLRWEIWGDTEMDADQSNPPYLQLDQAIRYTEWPEWSDQDGRTTHEAVAEAVYDAGYTKMFEAALLTDLAAFP